MPTGIKYSQQFKDDVLTFYANNPNMQVRQICRDFGIGSPTFYEWRKQAREAGNTTTDGSSTSQGGGGVSFEEHRKLQKRNVELEQEIYVLKRAAAYFAKDVLPKGKGLPPFTLTPTSAKI